MRWGLWLRCFYPYAAVLFLVSALGAQQRERTPAAPAPAEDKGADKDKDKEKKTEEKPP